MHESERDAGADFDSAPETYSEPEQYSEKVRQAVDNVQVLQGLDEQSIAAMIASAVAPFVSEQEIVQESFKRKYIPLATATLTICGFRQLALSQAIEKIADLPSYREDSRSASSYQTAPHGRSACCGSWSLCENGES